MVTRWWRIIKAKYRAREFRWRESNTLAVREKVTPDDQHYRERFERRESLSRNQRSSQAAIESPWWDVSSREHCFLSPSLLLTSVSPSDAELETVISGRDLDNTSLEADSRSNSERAEMILGILPGCTTYFSAALQSGMVINPSGQGGGALSRATVLLALRNLLRSRRENSYVLRLRSGINTSLTSTYKEEKKIIYFAFSFTETFSFISFYITKCVFLIKTTLLCMCNDL